MPSVFRATPESLAIAHDFAHKFGVRFDAGAAERDANRLLTLYFEDIARTWSPRFDHVSMAEFTRRRINAYAELTELNQALVHIDQQLDMWLLGLVHLLCVRAFHVLAGDELRKIERLLLATLDVRDRPRDHERVRSEMLAVFVEYSDALVVAHELSVASTVFVTCHELAHHDLNHLVVKASPDIEFEADRLGHEIMREVYLGSRELVTLRRQPYSVAGGWLLLKLFDLADRRQAQRSGLPRRRSSVHHPSAIDRSQRLLALLRTERDERLKRFLTGMDATIEEVLRDIGLCAVK